MNHLNPRRAAIFGAGAFGSWTALELARRGALVELFDAWGAGNPRASSGGETRVIRATYGSHAVYTRMAARALALWRNHERRYGQGLLRTPGALWLFHRIEPFAAASAAALRAVGLHLDELDPIEARRRYPQIDFSGVASVLFEPDAGYLFASRACRHVVSCLVAEGGRYVQAAAVPPLQIGGPVERVALSDGSSVEADVFVFACGPWLGSIFPDVIGSLVTATRQEVHYFGPPPGDTRFNDDRLPVWLDFGERFIYGIPGVADGGFKVADDTPGPPMDPTTDDRVPGVERVAAIRSFLKNRFPALGDAPLVRSEVCQYENTPDANFIIDRHPGASNVWIVGGGSGHGFKMGPAIGEIVAAQVLGESEPDPTFGLARFASPPAGGWAAKWS
jgi:glycine/D-amino acid oxidase-like deaminating enzyme